MWQDPISKKVFLSRFFHDHETSTEFLCDEDHVLGGAVMGSDREVFYITFKNESAGDHHSPLSVKLYKADSFSGDIRALQEIGDTK